MSLRSSSEGVAESSLRLIWTKNNHGQVVQSWVKTTAGFFAKCDSRYESLKSKLRLIHFAYNLMPLKG